MKPTPKMPAKPAAKFPSRISPPAMDSDDDSGPVEAGEGTPEEEAEDAREQAAAKKTAPAVKKPAAKTAKAPMKAAPRVKTDPKDPDADGEANPSKGKAAAVRPASFFARMSKKSGARTI